MADVLFQVTQEQLETGLRGYPCGYCTTSYVDPQKGLFYIGKPLSELSHKQPEEVLYLLYFGKEGSSSQVQEFYKRLKACLEKAIQ
jgi:citrate synthase